MQIHLLYIVPFLDKNNVNQFILQSVHIIESYVLRCTCTYLRRPVKLQEVFVRSTEQQSTRSDGSGWHPHWTQPTGTRICAQLNLQKCIVILHSGTTIHQEYPEKKHCIAFVCFRNYQWYLDQGENKFHYSRLHRKMYLYCYKTTTTTFTTINNIATCLGFFCCFLTPWRWPPWCPNM